MLSIERNGFADEANHDCDFSSIMDCAQPYAPNFTGTVAPNNMCPGGFTPGKSFFDAYLEEHPDVTFTPESIARGLSKMLTNAGIDVDETLEELKQRWTPRVEEPKVAADPVGDLILHFNIFYEHVYLLEGYPKEAQPQLHELRLLGTRVHQCLLNRDGSLNTENVQRVEEANIHVTLDGEFIQAARGKAILRQRV